MNVTRSKLVRTGLRVVTVAAAIALTAPVAAAQGQATHPTGLVVPDEVSLTAGNDGAFTASINVSNPTPGAVSVNEVGTEPGGNPCTVRVTDGNTIPPFRSTTIALTVRAHKGTCADPMDGTHSVLLSAAGGLAASDSEIISLKLKKGASVAEEPKPTGLVWPTDPIFLRRGGNQKLNGTIEVFNPTNAVIAVSDPKFPETCRQHLKAHADIRVEPAQQGLVKLVDVEPCQQLDTESITLSVSAHTAGYAKQDTQAIVAKAGANFSALPAIPRRFAGWFGLPTWLAIILLLACLIGLGSYTQAVTSIAGEHPHKLPVKGLDPLYVSSSSPTSWLTGISGIGTVAAAFLVNSDLFKSVLGAAPAPQLSLMLAGGLIAAAFVGLAAILMGIPFKQAEVINDVRQTPVQIWQFTLGAVLTATGVGIQLWAITVGAYRLHFAVPWWAIALAAGVGALALVVYLWWSIYYYIETYSPRPAVPAAPPPSPEMIYAEAAAIRGQYTDDLDAAKFGEWYEKAKQAAAERVVAGKAAGTGRIVIAVRAGPPPGERRNPLRNFI